MHDKVCLLSYAFLTAAEATHQSSTTCEDCKATLVIKASHVWKQKDVA